MRAFLAVSDGTLRLAGPVAFPSPQEAGSAPEFSTRVWPYVLSRVLLPASRNAWESPPSVAVLQPPPHSSQPAPDAPPPAPPSKRPQSSLPASVHSDPGHAGCASTASASPGPACPATLPASRGVFALDVGSWVHTSAPQLFRAAAVVVIANARVAAPLGVPTLMAFFEPHVCCRRRIRRDRAPSSGTSPRRPQTRPSPRPSPGSSRTEAEAEAEAAAAAGASGSRSGGGAEEGQRISVAGLGAGMGQRSWEAEVEAAAAAGTAVAEECGVTGDELVSRMALEAIGLLIEGLVGQQVKELVVVVAGEGAGCVRRGGCPCCAVRAFLPVRVGRVFRGCFRGRG